MAARKGKKEKQAKTPEVTQVEERSTEKEIAPGKGFYESDWSVCMCVCLSVAVCVSVCVYIYVCVHNKTVFCIPLVGINYWREKTMHHLFVVWLMKCLNHHMLEYSTKQQKTNLMNIVYSGLKR